MKYKKGDMVRIKTHEELLATDGIIKDDGDYKHGSGSWIMIDSEMTTLCGESAVIEKVEEDLSGGYYFIIGISCWEDWMIAEQVVGVGERPDHIDAMQGKVEPVISKRTKPVISKSDEPTTKCICGEPGEWRDGGKYFLCDIHYNPVESTANDIDFGDLRKPRVERTVYADGLSNRQLQSAINALLNHTQNERVEKHLGLLLYAQAARLKGYIQYNEIEPNE